MRSSLRAVVAALALLTALPACAKQPTPKPRAANDADPALWVVKDRDTTIYLFGTIHVLKPGLTWFDEAVKTAFDKSGTVMLELVQPPAAEMQALVLREGTVPPGGPTLTQQLPADKRAAYAKALSDMGLPAAAFDQARPWYAAVNLSLLPLIKLGYDPANGPEEVISAAAKRAGKPVAGLETAAEQIGYFAKLSEGAQVEFLTSTVDELPSVGTSMQKMVRDWSNGDPAALAKEINDSLKDSPEVARVLLTERNGRWAQWIKRRMAQPGVVFVAVGAGHLAGPESVQAQLQRIGVRSARVNY